MYIKETLFTVGLIFILFSAPKEDAFLAVISHCLIWLVIEVISINKKITNSKKNKQNEN